MTENNLEVVDQKKPLEEETEKKTVKKSATDLEKETAAEPKKTVKKAAAKPKAKAEDKTKAEVKEKSDKPAAKKAVKKPEEKTTVEKKPETKKAAKSPEETKEKPKAKKEAAVAKDVSETIRIKLVKGFSGRTQKQKSTILSLGLRRIGDITVQPNNEATKGKIAKINHVIEIID